MRNFASFFKNECDRTNGNDSLSLGSRAEAVFVLGRRSVLDAAAIILGALCFSAVAISQVPAAATTSPLRFSGGTGFSVFNTDWAPKDMIGVTAFADAVYHAHYGIEVEGRTTQFNRWSNVREDTIGGGAKYNLSMGRFGPFAKGLIGIGSIDFPDPSLPTYTHDTFFIYEVGGGSEYNLNDMLALRAEWDYQIWGRWPPHGLTPRGTTIGVVWRVSNWLDRSRQ